MTSTGEWYVAIRATSATLTPEQLLGRIDQTFAAIGWPKEPAIAPSVEPIGACATTLAQGEDAQPVSDEGSVMLTSALSAALGDSIKTAVAARPVRWCRDARQLDGASVYRPDSADDRYLIAFQDAGRGIWVTPNGLAGILAGATSNTKPSWMVELIDIDRHVGLGSFKTLPNVAQALWLSENGKRSYSSMTWGKNKTIEISADAK
jgi:hypothetical protein